MSSTSSVPNSPLFTAPDPTRELVCDGFLNKFGGPLNRWKRRYVRLDVDGNLSWYENNSIPLANHFKGCYNISFGARYRKADTSELKDEPFPFVVSVSVTDKHLNLGAESESERDKWLLAIKKFAASWAIKQSAKEKELKSKSIKNAQMAALASMGLIDEAPKRKSAKPTSPTAAPIIPNLPADDNALANEMKSVDKEGYLNKQSQILRQWRRRYFVLTSAGRLIYWKKSSKKVAEKMGIREIKLSSIQIMTDEDSGSYGLSISISGTTDLLMADTEQERDSWVIALSKYGSAPPDLKKYLNYNQTPTAATTATVANPAASDSSVLSSVASHLPSASLSALGNNIDASDLELSPILTNQGNESWLNKLSKHMKNWKKRYFVLTDDGKLEYYKDRLKKLEDRLGVLDVKDSVIRYGEPSELNRQSLHTFVVSIGSRLVHLQSKNEVEQRAWVQALSKFGEGPREVDTTKMSSKAMKVMQQTGSNSNNPSLKREGSFSGKSSSLAPSGFESDLPTIMGSPAVGVTAGDEAEIPAMAPLASPRDSSASVTSKGKSSKLAAMLGETALPTQTEVRAEIAASKNTEYNAKLVARGIDPDSMEGEKGRSLILLGTGRESFLLKRSDVFGIWKERYAVLTVDGKLNFYNNHAARSLQPRVSLDVRGCLIRCLEICIDTDREFAFEIISTSRRISLAASSDKERLNWCLAIGEHGDFDNSNQSDSSTPQLASVTKSGKTSASASNRESPSDSPENTPRSSTAQTAVVKGKSSIFSVFTGKDKANPAEEKPERHGIGYLQSNESSSIGWPRYLSLYHDSLVYYLNSNSPTAIGEISLSGPTVRIQKESKLRLSAPKDSSISEDKFNPESDTDKIKGKPIYAMSLANYSAEETNNVIPSNGMRFVFAFESLNDCDEWFNSLVKIQKKARTIALKEQSSSGGTARPAVFHQFFTNVHAGWLSKLGGLMKNKWTDRFFVIQQQFLTTWKDEESAGISARINGAVPHVIINLLGSNSSKTQFDGVEFGFTLNSKADKNDGTARAYQLHTDSLDSLLKWIAVLNAGNNLDRLAMDSANREKQQKKEHAFFVHRKSEAAPTVAVISPVAKNPNRGSVPFPKIKKKDDNTVAAATIESKADEPVTLDNSIPEVDTDAAIAAANQQSNSINPSSVSSAAAASAASVKPISVSVYDNNSSINSPSKSVSSPISNSRQNSNAAQPANNSDASKRSYYTPTDLYADTEVADSSNSTSESSASNAAASPSSSSTSSAAASSAVSISSVAPQTPTRVNLPTTRVTSVSFGSPSNNNYSAASPARNRISSSVAATPASSVSEPEPTADSADLPPGHPLAPVINMLSYDKFHTQLLWSDNGSIESGNSASSFTIIIRDSTTNSILGKPAVAIQSPLTFKLHTLILNANALGHSIQVSVQALNNFNGGSVSSKSNIIQFTAGSFGNFSQGDPNYDLNAGGAIVKSIPPSSRVSVSTGISPALQQQISQTRLNRGVSINNSNNNNSTNNNSNSNTGGASAELLAIFAKKSISSREPDSQPALSSSSS